MPNLFALVIVFALAGYVFGKRTGKQTRYALLSIPLALVIYVAVFILMGQTAYG